jgi:hypothetical protein
VGFGNVPVREHSVTLGYHTLCECYGMVHDFDSSGRTDRVGGSTVVLERVIDADRSLWGWNEEQTVLELLEEPAGRGQRRPLRRRRRHKRG